MIDPDNLVNASGAAALCGMSRQRWDQLMGKGKTPAPVMRKPYRLWDRGIVIAWAMSRADALMAARNKAERRKAERKGKAPADERSLGR